MRFLLTGDWHGDAVTHGVIRRPDVKAAAMTMVEWAVRLKVDVFGFLGDLSDPDNVRSHGAAAIAMKAAVGLEHNNIDSFWMTGNHDVIEDGSGESTLESMRAAGFDVVKTARQASFEQGEIGAVWLPYVPRSHAYDPEVFVRSCCDRNMPRDDIKVVFSHLMIEGIGPGSESVDMARGRDLWLPQAAIRECFPKARIFNAHYHRAQLFNGIGIPGAPARLRFDEETNNPAYIIVDIP